MRRAGIKRLPDTPAEYRGVVLDRLYRACFAANALRTNLCYYRPMDRNVMDVSTFRCRLESGGEAVVLLFEAADEREWLYRPGADRWSLVEIANHLADEETDDFRRRLRSLVEDPAREWPRFDTFAAVTSGEYARRDFEESVERFTHERSTSLSWLESLDSIDPDVRYSGDPPLSAGDLMLSWLAHDYFHIRQIARLRWDYLNAVAPPYRSDYAGQE